MRRVLSVVLAVVLLVCSIPVATVAAEPASFATRFSVNWLEGKWKNAEGIPHNTISVEYQMKGDGIKSVQGAWIAVDISKLIWADIEYDGENVNDYIGVGKDIVPGEYPVIFKIMSGDTDISSSFFALKPEVSEDRKVIDSWMFSSNNYIYVAVSADGNTLYICAQPSQAYSVNYEDFTTVVSFRFAVRPSVPFSTDSIRFITDEERDALNQSFKVAMNDGMTGFYYGDKLEEDSLSAPIITGDVGISGKPGDEIEILPGDVSGDGDFDSEDKEVLVDAIFNPDGLTTKQIIVADVNRDGEIDTADLVLIAKSQLDESHKFHKELEW